MQFSSFRAKAEFLRSLERKFGETNHSQAACQQCLPTVSVEPTIVVAGDQAFGRRLEGFQTRTLSKVDMESGVQERFPKSA